MITKKRVLSFVLSFVFLFCNLGQDLINVYANDNSLSNESTIKLGDYVQMGNYLGEPILWRCVSFEKISGYDSNGNPIIDSTDTVTEYKDGYLPLILSDRVLCIKAFDGNGSNLNGSHKYGFGKSTCTRLNSGSNYWGDSNIRNWLNSSSDTGMVQWTCGNPPNAESMTNGYNAYATEKGFLNSFSDREMLAIKTVTQKTILDAYEYINGDYEYRTPILYDSTIEGCVQNYTSANSEQCTDSIFLLDVKQVNTVYNNLGEYYKAKPTQAAVLNSDYKDSSYLNYDNIVSYWLRTVYTEGVYYLYSTFRPYSCRTRIVNETIGYAEDNTATIGVRPAFYLNINNIDLSVGNGEYDNPYSISECDSNKMVAKIDGIKEITYDKDKKTYNINEFCLYVTAENQVNMTNFNKITANDTMVTVKLTLPDGFSFSNNEIQKVKEYSTTAYTAVENTVYINNPSIGIHKFTAEVTNLNGEVFTDELEVNVIQTGFNEDIYRANHNITKGVSAQNIEEFVINQDTPAEILQGAADNNGMYCKSYTWEVFNGSLNTVDNPSKLIDYTLEERDMYKAMIFEMLDFEIDNKLNDFTSDKNRKKFESFKSTVIEDLKDFYTYNELTNGFFTDKAKKEKAMELVKNRFKVNFPLIDEMDGVFDDLEYTGNFLDILDQMYNNYKLYMLDSSIKQMLTDMYNEAPSDNLALKEALLETKNLIESSEVEFMGKMAACYVQMAGKDAAEYGIKKIWDKAKEKAYEAYPELAVAHAIIKSGQFITETMFNTSEITEAYYKLNAVNYLGLTVNAAYNKQKNNFLSNKSEINARNYNAAINILGAYYVLNCDTTENFSEAVEDALFYKAFNVNNSEQLKNSIESMKNIMKGYVNGANTEWITYLEDDYPELYHYYDTKRDKYKVYNIHCPVDVYVFDKNGVLVACSEGDSLYYNGAANLTIAREDDKKTVYTYDDEYNVIYKATGNGTMDIIVNEYVDNENTATVNFNNIELKENEEYKSIENGKYGEDANYSIEKNNINILPDYNSNESSTKYKVVLKRSIIAKTSLQEGEYCEGEKINIITYVPENVEFIGWESDADVNIFDDEKAISTIVTMPAKNVNIKANIKVTHSLGSCGENTTWEISDNTLRIKGTGATYDYETENLPFTEFSDIIEKIVVSEGVSYIGNNMFSGLTNVTDIKLPKTLSAIGTNTFDDCTSLKNLVIRSSDLSVSAELFEDCSALKVKCYEGSASDNTELYPSQSVIEYLPLITIGDVNDDGETDVDDALLIFKYTVDLQELDDNMLQAADVNKDDLVDVDDALQIQKYIVDLAEIEQ
ncbi:MAG: leucine-rich repeat protein [Firmicutes bacterium]|nr:leucine-rich repeat protein [Bacillota bacterium]